MDERYRQDIVRNDNGEEMPRWIKYRKDKQKLDKLLKKQGKGFYERFDSILAKHEKKSEQLGYNDRDVEMADERTTGDNRGEYRSKRKRDVDDEDTIMESMKHMRVESGRKRCVLMYRSGNCPTDFLADLEMLTGTTSRLILPMNCLSDPRCLAVTALLEDAQQIDLATLQEITTDTSAPSRDVLLITR